MYIGKQSIKIKSFAECLEEETNHKSELFWYLSWYYEKLIY
jgi:hypothetical protein